MTIDRAKTIEMAREAGCDIGDGGIDWLSRFAALVRAQVLRDVLQTLDAIATHRGDTWGDGFNTGVLQAERAVRGMADAGHSTRAVAEASTAPPEQAQDLRYIQRVLESDAPKEDRERAAQLVRQMRLASRPPESLRDALFWLRGALECGSFQWDHDQRECAKAALMQAQRWTDAVAPSRRSADTGRHGQDRPDESVSGPSPSTPSKEQM